MQTLPVELENRVRAELQGKERLVWAGQPKPSRWMWSSVPIVLFGIPFTAFALFWISMASGLFFGAHEVHGHGQPDVFSALFSCFPLFGVPFLIVGLGMLTSPIWMYRRAKKTCYALTDQRAIIWRSGWFGSVEVRSYRASELGKMTRRTFADGSGDLIFEEVVSVGQDSHGHTRSYRTEHGFMGIENVRDVEDMIRRTLLKSP